MRQCTSIVLVLLFLATGFFVAMPGAAQEATPASGSAAVLAPDAEVAGLSLAEWSAREWQWWVSIPMDINPAINPSAANCGLGQSGPVFFLTGVFAETDTTLPCIVPEGTVLFLGLGGADCSTVEPPPFFGRDAAELEACVEPLADEIVIEDLELTVDGELVDDLGDYRAATGVFPLTFPENNVFGVPAGVALAAADGYQVMIGPLAVGEHLLEVTVPGPDGSPIVITYEITVAAPTVIEPAASPEATGSPEAIASPGA